MTCSYTPPFEPLSFGRKASRVYARLCAPVLQAYSLSQTEFDLLLFLANHPDDNTARDACRIRGIKKGLVSLTVDTLLRRGLIARSTDPDDRRILRLDPTPDAEPIIRDGRAVQQEFFRLLTACLTPEELEIYSALTRKLARHLSALDHGGN